MPLPARWLLIRTRSGDSVLSKLNHGGMEGIVKVLDSNKSQITWDEASLIGDCAMGELRKGPVLVLSQTCDIQSKNFIQVAPIYPATGDEHYVERLAKGDIYSAFYLKKRDPEIKSISFADLEQIQAMHKSYIKKLNPAQHFRLKPHIVRILQRFITRYFGRPNSYDAGSDLAPLTGTYLCVSCFYMEGMVMAVNKEKGDTFSNCKKCNGQSWVIRGS